MNMAVSTLLCDDQSLLCSKQKCFSWFLAFIDADSCANRILVVSVDLLFFLTFLLYSIVHCVLLKKPPRSSFSSRSLVSLLSAVFNGLLGLTYLGYGTWIVAQGTISPLYRWLAPLIHGSAWLLLSLSITLRKLLFSRISIAKAFSIFSLFFGAFLCVTSIVKARVNGSVCVETVLDSLCFIGGILLILSSFCESAKEEPDFYTPLQGGEYDCNDVTPFSKSGFLSNASFWWLNPLMKKGNSKVLGERDVPRLRIEDRAETLYSNFTEEFGKNHSILSAIFVCHRKPILISGIFALIKVLTMACNPIFLALFMGFVEGDSGSKIEGYALMIALFAFKVLESLSERQWFFRTRLVGLRARSLLSAAIYQKQLRLSNAAKSTHSPGDIVNYVTVDAYRIGEFPFWLHQIWSTSLQLFLALQVIYFCVGLATVSALLALVLTLSISSPLAKLQIKYYKGFSVAQGSRLKSLSEALANMKVLKLYSWENHFKSAVERLRNEELGWLFNRILQRNNYIVLLWSSPLLVGVVTFWTCHFLGTELSAIKTFTFLATLRIVQEPIRMFPDVFGAFVEAKVSFDRIKKFLEAPELENERAMEAIPSSVDDEELIGRSVFIESSKISWDKDSPNATVRGVELEVLPGEKLAICGEVGSGKSTLLAAILGEVPYVNGIVQVRGNIAYVSQSAWIQTGTIKANILFGSALDLEKYRETLEKCSLVKDIVSLPFGDLTEIGERGVNLSGGQKQRIQLARALYQDADIYLLDDPFSAVDAHTATSLFNEYVMGALSSKTVLLVTHQVDFLPCFNSILLMSGGEISKASTYEDLMTSSQEFQSLVNAHRATSSSLDTLIADEESFSKKRKPSKSEIVLITGEEEAREERSGDQLIKQEEREIGDAGFKPYFQYLRQGNGFFFFSLANFFYIVFLACQLLQFYTFAAKLGDSNSSRVAMYTIYSAIACVMTLALLLRGFSATALGVRASRSFFSTLINSLFRAPMSFYDSTPVGRILSRVSLDMNIIDLDIHLKFIISFGTGLSSYTILGVLGYLTWPVLFVIVPMIFTTIVLQNYYLASAKELMRINGTTNSVMTSSLAESIAGATTIRAFGEERRLFSNYLELIDENASSVFHNFSASEWLIQRLETMCAVVLSASALAITLYSFDSSDSGFVGMAFSYGLSLNLFIVISVQLQCALANSVVSVERVEQYMHIPSEALEVVQGNRPAQNWPAFGKVEIHNLKVRYRPNSPLVLHGLSLTIEGGQKVGIVGRTGSGKTTLISVLFRLVEPTEGKIIVDGLDICSIGLHDLRSRLGIIPQDPTLFKGSIRFNLDPLSQHSDHEIWEVLEKCQLREAIQQKQQGLDSLVDEEGTNWSMGQRQLFCLGRALLKRSRILVLDEATASMDNATDSVLQHTIRNDFADCTVITVAHRIPTVMDCDKVLSISDGKLVEFDEPSKLMREEESLFGKLVNEYWSRASNNGGGY